MPSSVLQIVPSPTLFQPTSTTPGLYIYGSRLLCFSHHPHSQRKASLLIILHSVGQGILSLSLNRFFPALTVPHVRGFGTKSQPTLCVSLAHAHAHINTVFKKKISLHSEQISTALFARQCYSALIICICVSEGGYGD